MMQVFRQSPIPDPDFPSGQIVMTTNFEHTLGQEFKESPSDDHIIFHPIDHCGECGRAYALLDAAHFTDTVGGGNYLVDTIMSTLGRHLKGDWGECCEEDGQANDHALKNGERLLSVYTTKLGTKFWVITEWDRSVTTFLLPEDY